MNPASTSLLTEHLRWTPLSLIDDIINSINTLLYDSVTAVENFFTKSPPSLLGFVPPPGAIPDTDDDGNILYSEKEMEEISTGVHQLETLLENGVDKSFDRFELYVLRNILVVHPDLVGWVRLAHHKDLDFSTIPKPNPTNPANSTTIGPTNSINLATGADSTATTTDPTIPTNLTTTDTTPPAPPPAYEAQSRLRTLRQTLLASHALNATLNSEIATNNRTLDQLRTLVSASANTPSGTAFENSFLFLNANGGQFGGTKEAKDSASFAVSQVELIRSLVAKIRPQFEALQEQKRKREADEAVKIKSEDAEMVDAPVAAATTEEERKRYIERMTRRHMEASRGLRLNAKGDVVGGGFEGAAKKGLKEVEALEELVGSMVGDKKEENNL